MDYNNRQKDGEGVRRRIAELSDLQTGGSKRRLNLNWRLIMPVVLVFLMIIILRQAL